MTRLKKKIVNLIEQASSAWDLWDTDERILVAVSGGKDSLSLLNLLSEFRLNLYSLHVEISEDCDTSFYDFCKKKSIFQHIKTDIKERAFAQDNNKNPCYTCSRLKRKEILTFAKENSIKRIAFGHHKNDVVETVLLNLFFSREVSTMLPKQKLFEDSFEIIRPLYLVPEELLQKLSLEDALPVCSGNCSQEKVSKRFYIKKLIEKLETDHPKIDIIDNMFSGIFNVNKFFMPSRRS